MHSVGQKQTYWLGARNSSEEIIEWVTGEQSDYSNWGDGEPNDAFVEETYMHMVNTVASPYEFLGQWNDTLTNQSYGDVWYSAYNCGIIVEWEEERYPVLLSNLETIFLQEDPLSGNIVDSDGDGISDTEELVSLDELTIGEITGQTWSFYANPSKIDSDGDLMEDVFDFQPVVYNFDQTYEISFGQSYGPPTSIKSESVVQWAVTFGRFLKGAEFFGNYQDYFICVGDLSGSKITKLNGEPINEDDKDILIRVYAEAVLSFGLENGVFYFTSTFNYGGASTLNELIDDYYAGRNCYGFAFMLAKLQ